MKSLKFICISLFLFSLSCNTIESSAKEPVKDPKFKVVAFYTGKNDRAHVSFVHEANRWFSRIAPEYGFTYDSTNNWNNMNDSFLSGYDVVVFLDTRPDSSFQRAAFRKYMENGGAWMGFHFCAFALSPSAYPQNWDWYHNQFIGAGQYSGNTWAPTKAILRVEQKKHPATKNLPETFTASPNEWYKWEKDLRLNPDIEILVSIDSSSFPLGTGPKLHEIWHSGYYPMVWTNSKYKMLYINMGHNVIDYENKTNRELSFTFENEIQNKLITDGLIWLGK
ncbi:MAG: ThuA domain-containing protein [Bacteroidetes bacterium]|nr:ThuA domain-containing protein [Bacteroidota bacterium]